MQLNTVVLPAPFGPISAVMSPRRALKEKSLIATSPPKRMLRCSTLSTDARFARDAVSLPPAAGRADVLGAALIRAPRAPAAPSPARSPARPRAPAGAADRATPMDHAS